MNHEGGDEGSAPVMFRGPKEHHPESYIFIDSKALGYSLNLPCPGEGLKTPRVMVTCVLLSLSLLFHLTLTFPSFPTFRGSSSPRILSKQHPFWSPQFKLWCEWGSEKLEGIGVTVVRRKNWPIGVDNCRAESPPTEERDQNLSWSRMDDYMIPQLYLSRLSIFVPVIKSKEGSSAMWT